MKDDFLEESSSQKIKFWFSQNDCLWIGFIQPGNFCRGEEGKGSEAKAAFPSSPRAPSPIPAGFLIGRKCLRHFLHLMPFKRLDTFYNYSKNVARFFMQKQMSHSKNIFSRRSPIQSKPVGLRTYRRRYGGKDWGPGKGKRPNRNGLFLSPENI